MKLAELTEDRRRRKRKHFMYQNIPIGIVQSGVGSDTLSYGAEPVGEEILAKKSFTMKRIKCQTL